MLSHLLDYLFPKRSLTGEGGRWITDAERLRLASFPVHESNEQLRGRELRFIDAIHAGSTYQNCPLLKKAVHAFKYKGVRSLSKDLTQVLLHAKPPTKEAVLCPVPLHWTRLFSRGFNQAELLAKDLSRECALPVRHLLKRIRPTGHQARRNRAERMSAMGGSFVCRIENPPPFVILIDDLATTGATLDACAAVLKHAGVKRVEGWVVAHDKSGQ